MRVPTTSRFIWRNAATVTMGKGENAPPSVKGNGIVLDNANHWKKRGEERRVKPLRRVLILVTSAICG